MIATATQRRLTRILAMVPWVLANPYPSVSEVMERFGYETETDLAKDLSMLFVCGVPGYGPGDLMVAFIDDDRVVLDMADYFSRPLRLTPPEALGLLSAGMAVAGSSQANPALSRAVEKLASAVFPEGSDAIGAELPAEPDHLEALRRAAGRRHVVELTYLSVGTNRTTIREVEPLMVYASMGSWYLSARCRLADDRRTFRVDRIRTLSERAERFAAPQEADRPVIGFTPSADAIHATLALGPGGRWVAEYYPVDVIRDGEEEMLVRFAMSDARVAARLLVRLGRQARLVEGDEVARETERLRGAILAGYGES